MKLRLSVMMFLQYAIWGAWLPLFWAFITEHCGRDPQTAGYLFSVGAIGALVGPFLAGQFADRRFPTEKVLGISHLIGAALVWQFSNFKEFSSTAIFACVGLYSLIYAPTLALTNSLAFHHLTDRDREFGKVRVWGTIGWIAAGIGMGQWLFRTHSHGAADAAIRLDRVAGMADAFKVSAVLGIAQGLFSLFGLPHTPPQKGTQAFAPAEALQAILRNRRLTTLFLLAFPVACVHQFYFVHTESFLGHLKIQSDFINNVFGVGGGPMTIGQISEILVLASIPFLTKSFTRKTFLTLGLVAYTARFALFAFVPNPDVVVPTLALHGLCFGFVLFVAFMIVDEETPTDVRASAQNLFNFVIVGLGTIVGNLFASEVAARCKLADGSTDFERLFSIPMEVVAACLLLLLLLYPGGRKEPAPAA